jgi:putative endonuclease
LQKHFKVYTDYIGALPKNKETGNIGEAICACYLKNKGYKLLKKNWYKRWGEIDIIATHRGELVFIEVKTITSKNYCSAKELFNPAKRLRLVRTIKYFLHRQRDNIVNWRLDLVCVTKDGALFWIEQYKNVLAL